MEAQNFSVDYFAMHWSGDNNGDEVGYPEVNVIGNYSYNNVEVLVDVEGGQVYEAFEIIEEKDETNEIFNIQSGWSADWDILKLKERLGKTINVVLM